MGPLRIVICLMVCVYVYVIASAILYILLLSCYLVWDLRQSPQQSGSRPFRLPRGQMVVLFTFTIEIQQFDVVAGVPCSILPFIMFLCTMMDGYTLLLCI